MLSSCLKLQSKPNTQFSQSQKRGNQFYCKITKTVDEARWNALQLKFKIANYEVFNSFAGFTREAYHYSLI